MNVYVRYDMFQQDKGNHFR